MDKNLKSMEVDVVVRNEEGAIVFELKDSKKISREIFSEMKNDTPTYSKESTIVYPDQQIINSEIIYCQD
jgi:hypothetical protein